MVQPLQRTIWQLSSKLQIRLPFDPEIPLLGIYWCWLLVFLSFFKKNFYLLIWPHWVLVAECRTISCGLWTLSCDIWDGGAWWATVHGSQRVRHDWATSLSLSLSLTRDGTWAPCIGSLESWPLDHQGSPRVSLFILSVLLEACQL